MLPQSLGFDLHLVSPGYIFVFSAICFSCMITMSISILIHFSVLMVQTILVTVTSVMLFFSTYYFFCYVFWSTFYGYLSNLLFVHGVCVVGYFVSQQQLRCSSEVFLRIKVHSYAVLCFGHLINCYFFNIQNFYCAGCVGGGSWLSCRFPLCFTLTFPFFPSSISLLLSELDLFLTLSVRSVVFYVPLPIWRWLVFSS